MEQTQAYKRQKKSTIQLTSLLDLLFVMIFVSLIQQKTTTPVTEAPKPTPVEAKPVETKPIKTPKPVEKPTPKAVKIFLEATFNFYATSSNPNVPNGSYLMNGFYDKESGLIRLTGLRWINKPDPRLGMVPLNGEINSDETNFEGRIEFVGCNKFNLRRVSKSNETPISGQWKGTYDCAQGLTGLTLTIH